MVFKNKYINKNPPLIAKKSFMDKQEVLKLKGPTVWLTFFVIV